MSALPISPRLLKGGDGLLDAVTVLVQRIIALQYTPDTLARSWQSIELDADVRARKGRNP